ncbi:hypothetical protein OO010_10545 [Flavobacteriaceae bacterium KMM 6898]|nr:hypothetical protein [Flavobacteriaceae bacterium KMM 6898]
MGKIKIMLLLLCLAVIQTVAPQSISKKSNVYRAWISILGSSDQIQGYLYTADSSFVTLTIKNSFDLTNLQTIEAIKIDQIKLRKKGIIGKGVWIGALIGAGVGATAGLIGGDDPEGFLSFTKEENAVIYAVPTSILGCGVGALVSSKRTKLEIGGNQNVYMTQLDRLKGYSLLPNQKK